MYLAHIGCTEFRLCHQPGFHQGRIPQACKQHTQNRCRNRDPKILQHTVADRCWATFGNGRRRLSCLFPVFKWTTRIAKTAVRGLGIEKSSKAGVGRRARPSRVRHIDTRFGRTCTTRSVDFAPLSVARKSARFAFFRKKYRAAQNVATWSRWKEFLRISRRITS